MKDKDRNVLISEENVLRRWEEYFEGLMDKENEREKDGWCGEGWCDSYEDDKKWKAGWSR